MNGRMQQKQNVPRKGNKKYLWHVDRLWLTINVQRSRFKTKFLSIVRAAYFVKSEL